MVLKSNKLTGLSFYGLMQVGCILLLVFSLAPLFSGIAWYLDLFTHFRFQYLIIAMVLAIGFWVLKQKVYAALAVLLILFNAVYVIPIYTQKPGESSGVQDKTIKLFHINVLTSNTQYERLIEQVLSEDPDVVLLQEVDALWMTQLDVLRDKYQHQIEEPRADNFGLALFSRVSISDYEIHLWSDFEIPNIAAEFNLDGVAFRMVATHPPPPVNQLYFDARNSQFESIAALLKSDEMPTIVMGDLNTTMWSDSYQILLSETGLRNASDGFGFIPTWPTNLLPMMIPIDHCLVSEEFRVVDIRTVEGVGSDHLPLVVEFGF